MIPCKKCGSYAINHAHHGRDGSDGDLCDVCYWRKRADAAELAIIEKWLYFAADIVGQECCGQRNAYGCCGNPEPTYRDANDVINAMSARHRELSEKPTAASNAAM